MNFNRISKLVAVVTLAAGMMTGCGGADRAQVPVKDTNADTITVVHELGETEVPKNPEKVVVFDYGILDALSVLEVPVAGLPQGNLPKYLSHYEGETYANLGSLKEPDMEAIFELAPDLIIMSGRQADYYEALSEIAPTVHLGIDNKDYIGSFERNMTYLGEIFEKEEAVSEQLTKIKASIEDVNQKATASGQNALIALYNEGGFSIYGEGSRFGIIHGELGIPAVDTSIQDATHGQKASFEYVVEKNPDLFFVVDRTAVVGGEGSAPEFFSNELMKKTSAFQNDQIIYLDSEVWYTATGGFESTQKMIGEISNALKNNNN